MMLAVMAIASASVAMAQSGTGFPEVPSDPAAVPIVESLAAIVESLAALFGIGGAYALRLLKKKKNND